MNRRHMETKIWFVRHAKPDQHIREDALRPLTEQGRRDALRLVELFSCETIDRILTSPLPRAVETVRPLAEARGLEIQTEDAFRERVVGMWVEDFHEYARRQWADFDFRLEGGESLREVQSRNLAALERILDKHPGHSIVIGAHGTALSTVLHHYLPNFGYTGFLRILDEMPFIAALRFDGHRFVGYHETLGLSPAE